MLRLVTHNTASLCSRTIAERGKVTNYSLTTGSSSSLLFDFQEISPDIWIAKISRYSSRIML